MKRIVFQGDSITDAERSRDDLRMLGSGYPTIVSAIIIQGIGPTFPA